MVSKITGHTKFIENEFLFLTYLKIDQQQLLIRESGKNEFF